MGSIKVTVSEDLNNFILEQCGSNIRARAGYIRSILHMVRNGILLLKSSDNKILTYQPSSRIDEDIEAMTEKRKLEARIQLNPLLSKEDQAYVIEGTQSIISELKERFGIIQQTKETKDTIHVMRAEQKKISALLAPDPP